MATNLVVVQGVCGATPVVRTLESGRRLASLALRVRPDQGPATSVPITVWEPRPWIDDLAEGDELVVVGSVKRRFFATAGAGRGTRVDVEGAFVARAGNRRQVEAALRRATSALRALEARATS
jgi:hypothetical protein